jgi:hypothetical protein
MRVDAIVPRLDAALEAARSMGMTVMLCPSDVVENVAAAAGLVGLEKLSRAKADGHHAVDRSLAERDRRRE